METINRFVSKNIDQINSYNFILLNEFKSCLVSTRPVDQDVFANHFGNGYPSRQLAQE